MAGFIEPINRLINEFSKLPGVGRKTAQRYALKMLDFSDDQVQAFVSAIINAKQNVKVCSVCGNLTDSDPCKICNHGDSSTICVVKEAKDILTMEKIGDFHGVYHVLGGVIDPLNGIGVDDIRLPQLFKRLTGDINEVILALDTTTEGEATSAYIARTVKLLGIKVTRLAQGISIGSELQYTDEATLTKAFHGRKEI